MFKKTTLPNGLRIITMPMESTKTVTVLILVRTGSKYETKEINGISHFLEHLFFKGTKRRPTLFQLVKELDGIGGVHNAFTAKEETGFFIKADSKHLDLALDILSDMLLNSKFDPREIEKERKVIFEEINMIRDVPQRYVVDLWEELLYGDQPAGRPISGVKESVKKIKREDILNYFHSHYAAKNMAVILAGNIEDGKVASKIKKCFSGIAERDFCEKTIAKEIQKSPRMKIHFKETDQAHLILGTRTFNLFDERKYPLAVLATLLGGLMSSRLFIALREKRGICYYVHTAPEHYTDTGYLATSAGVDNRRVEEAVKIIIREYQKLCETKVGRGELKKVKESIKGRLYLGLETSDAWAGYIGEQEILEGKILTPEEECAKIDKVTADDILAVARQIFRNDKLNLAMIGPFKDQIKFQQLLKI